MATKKEKQLAIIILKERIERMTGKKVILGEQRKKFIDKLEKTDNFIGIDSYLNESSQKMIKELERLSNKKIVLREDDYYPPEPRRINHKAEVERIVQEYMDDTGGNDSEFFYVRGSDGEDIEYGSKPWVDASGFKHKPGTMSKEEWEEVANGLIEKLAHDGYEGYELDLLGATGFRMSREVKEITEGFAVQTPAEGGKNFPPF